MLQLPKVLNIKNCGYKVPYGAVYVGRAMPRYGLPASKWGNPARIGRGIPREFAIDLYRTYLKTDAGKRLLADVIELRGKDLICWCAPLPCHADILLELANKPVM